MQVPLAAADGGGQLAAQRQPAPGEPDHQAGTRGRQQQAQRHEQPGLLAEGGGQRGAWRGGDRQPFLVARGGIQRVLVQPLAGIAQQVLQQDRVHAVLFGQQTPIRAGQRKAHIRIGDDIDEAARIDQYVVGAVQDRQHLATAAGFGTHVHRDAGAVAGDMVGPGLVH
ncbi:hypothetical protein G6F50_015336 [Rhizopus delemar]|uniref:Uncharacterized protein n=1 Tax=Rhizopus delemar TaxID=936053 RepID=A0A9P6XYF6_9FUNG|nr:hypothetical protein G6F50_015336 [Rhizopus delemar]